MPQDKYNHLLMQRGGKYSWEAIPNPDLQISDLDENAIGVLAAVAAKAKGARVYVADVAEKKLQFAMDSFGLEGIKLSMNKAAGDVGYPSINSSGLYFGNSPVSVGYRLVSSNKGSTLSSQIQMFSPLFAYSHNIF